MKLGCFHVNPQYNTGSSVLEDGAAGIATFGFENIGLFMTPAYATDYDGQVWGSTPTTLAQLAATGPMQTVWGNSSLSKYFLKTWTFASGIFDPWRESATSVQLAAEYAEQKAFAIWLLQNTSGKDFVITTSESDWAFIGDTVTTLPIPEHRAQRAVAFFDCLIRAVRDARREAGPSTSRVFSCIEVNRVLDPQRRIHRDVLPYLQPDMIALSLYEAINDWIGGIGQAASIASIDTKIRAVVREVRNAYATANGRERAARIPIHIGEFGWPEANTQFTTLDVGAFIDQVIATCDDLGIATGNFWQFWGNDIGPAGGMPDGVLTEQCVYKQNGSLSLQGQKLQTLLA